MQKSGNNSYPKIKTDETLRENASHGNDKYPFQYYLEDIWQFDFHCVDWHWHSELEFVYIKNGVATIYVGNTKLILTSGNGIFINTKVIHRFESSASTIIPNIVFSPLLLSSKESLIYQKYIQPLLTATDFQVFSPEVAWQKEVLKDLIELFSIQEETEPSELQTVQLLFKIWQLLFDNTNTISTTRNNTTDIKDQARLQIILQYIHENYASNLTLEDLTQLVSLSKSSVLNLFNTYIHESPIDYVLHYRLKKAAHLLLTTENSISYIAQNTGFNNVTYFCRKFKKIFQLTPGQYRTLKS